MEGFYNQAKPDLFGPARGVNSQAHAGIIIVLVEITQSLSSINEIWTTLKY